MDSDDGMPAAHCSAAERPPDDLPSRPIRRIHGRPPDHLEPGGDPARHHLDVLPVRKVPGFRWTGRRGEAAARAVASPPPSRTIGAGRRSHPPHLHPASAAPHSFGRPDLGHADADARGVEPHRTVSDSAGASRSFRSRVTSSDAGAPEPAHSWNRTAGKC